MTGRICGTGSYVPARIVENEELANLVDTNDAWIRERTGIARRHLAEQETTSYMAAMAAKRALAQAGMLAEEVGWRATLIPVVAVPKWWSMR